MFRSVLIRIVAPSSDKPVILTYAVKLNSAKFRVVLSRTGAGVWLGVGVTVGVGATVGVVVATGVGVAVVTGGNVPLNTPRLRVPRY